MNLLMALFFDVGIYQFFNSWLANFVLIAFLFDLLLFRREFFDTKLLVKLFQLVVAFSVIDLLKYGRVGVSLIFTLLVLGLFFLLQKYFLSSQTFLIVLLYFFVVLLDMWCVRFWILGQGISFTMVIKELCGNLASLTLAFLGTRSSRLVSFFEKDTKRKVWTPNRKSAL